MRCVRNGVCSIMSELSLTCQGPTRTRTPHVTLIHGVFMDNYTGVSQPKFLQAKQTVSLHELTLYLLLLLPFFQTQGRTLLSPKLLEHATGTQIHNMWMA